MFILPLNPSSEHWETRWEYIMSLILQRCRRVFRAQSAQCTTYTIHVRYISIICSVFIKLKHIHYECVHFGLGSDRVGIQVTISFNEDNSQTMGLQNRGPKPFEILWQLIWTEHQEWCHSVGYKFESHCWKSFKYFELVSKH